MLKKIVNVFGGDPNKKELEQFGELVAEVNDLEANYEALSDAELKAKTAWFKDRISTTQTGVESDSEKYEVVKDVLNEILPDAFATVREVSKRTLGQRHYDVQVISAAVLHKARISEMRT